MYPNARFTLLGCVARYGHEGQYEWKIIIRCQDGEVLTFHPVAMGTRPPEAAEQMKKDAEALLCSSGYKITESPKKMEGWTATWDVIGNSGQQQ